MAHGDLLSTLITAIDPVDVKAMPAVLQSTIDLLEAELATARAALKEIQPESNNMLGIGENVINDAMEAYRQNLIGRALSGKIQGLAANYPTQDDMLAAMLQSGNVLVEDLGPVTKPADLRYPTSLFDIMANSLVLDHLAPYLSISSLLSLASTSKTARSLVMDHPYVFRHLDLSRCSGALVHSNAPLDRGGETWRSERMDESLTEDDFYSGPLRGIFNDLGKRSILQDVRTLILDGLSVPADLVSEIVLSDRFSVNILSIRDCLHLNERKLMQTLAYAVRPSRPKGSPRLKGLYYFSSKAITSRGCGLNSRSGTKVAEADLAKNEWYRSTGRVLKGKFEGWGPVLQLCQGIIAFDAVLCRGPRHDANLYSPDNEGRHPAGPFLQPTIATFALGSKGCDTCHSTPEEPAIWGRSPDEQFPLLYPPPMHSSRIVSAKSPVSHLDDRPALMVSCADCVADRCCQRCGKWWCSTCLPHPERAANSRRHQTAHRPANGNPKTARPGVSRDCWECGSTCASCNSECQRQCATCMGGYCIEHNDGCSATNCDWCNISGRRRTRELR